MKDLVATEEDVLADQTINEDQKDQLDSLLGLKLILQGVSRIR